MSDLLFDLSSAVGSALISRGWKIACAESCTGGGLCYWLTSIAGSSDWFDRGFVVYTETAKQEMLGVNLTTLEQHGAVSQQTAQEMAEKTLSRSKANVSIAITGIAGPSGGSSHKPVGTVWIAWAGPFKTVVSHSVFAGNRTQIREQAIQVAFEKLLKLIQTSNSNT